MNDLKQQKAKKMQTDNGLEFVNEEFNTFCKLSGIVRHKIVRHTPQQNGLVERMNRTIINKVRCMLVESRLPK